MWTQQYTRRLEHHLLSLGSQDKKEKNSRIITGLLDNTVLFFFCIGNSDWFTSGTRSSTSLSFLSTLPYKEACSGFKYCQYLYLSNVSSP